MSKKIEAKLYRSGKKKGLVGRVLDKYVYGTMNKLGLMGGNKDTKQRTLRRSK